MKIKSSVPEGQSGVWKVEKFEISKEDARSYNLRNQIQLFQGRPYRPVEPGIFTRLMRNGTVVMSDTPAETEDLDWFAQNVIGNVLINGLGLGIAAEIALSKPLVSNVTVVEISEDVINLVGVPLSRKCPKDKSLVVILGDAFKWKPPKGVKYNTVWHDIWDNICSDNLVEMSKLRRKYCKRAQWQGFWAYYDHLRIKGIGW